MRYYITVEIEIEAADTVEEAAKFAAEQLMHEAVNFTIENSDGDELGTFNTEDFA